ncbi:membrane protein [Mycobacteroides abscessus subsp. bolletii]|uniref:Membrane protein n=2 Tax=Mycobacteroides abscessus TaxID=36809 RepID=A0A9Q7WI20_9MYCO|nr:membrane protein [Mycobacteroides abscessus subsp. bolletii]SHV35115.1 membrane protein [Mycobacteroides abscessus subsp. bolletii]SHX10970.1 membrane protein [Mycobacteroides abscessus subsp. bolletii]SIB33966.1 membrane protein [Mycobacteroides abscessus subsp. bolletii]SIJ11737.1 membrane protein [Mycobacteroides abscessus subsp. bolletii]
MTHPRKRHAGARILFGLLATIVSMSAGCTPTEQPPIPFTGLTKDLRIRWSAEPGIDLLTGPAVIVRAYRESYVVGGLMANPAYYYPGFEHAVPQNGPNVSPLIRPLVTGDSQLESRGFQTTTPIVGTWREHILSLTGDPTSGYTAKVCVWDTGTGVQVPNGQYRYPNRLPSNSMWSVRAGVGTLAVRITITPPPPFEPDPTKKSQQGSAPNPSTDIFGGWKIRAADSLGIASWMDQRSDWPLDDFRLTLNACGERAPDLLTGQGNFITVGDHPRSDFPTLPADPGWPAAGT